MEKASVATAIFSNLVLSISFLFPYLPTVLFQLNQIMYVLQENELSKQP